MMMLMLLVFQITGQPVLNRGLGLGLGLGMGLGMGMGGFYGVRMGLVWVLQVWIKERMWAQSKATLGPPMFGPPFAWVGL